MPVGRRVSTITPVSNEQNPPKKRGCFFYGCISLVIVSVLGVLVAYLGFRYVMKTADRLIAEYTDTKPALIESVEVSPEQLNALQKRVAAFKAVLDAQKVSQELALSAEDLNALISSDPSFKDLKNKLFVNIEDDRIKGKVSIPLENLGPFKLKGRYLNGMAAFKVSLESGTLVVLLDELEVKGKSLPPQLLAQFRKQNLAQDAQSNTNTAQVIQKFESIRVKDGTVILKNKATF